MRAKFSLSTVLAVAVLAGCESVTDTLREDRQLVLESDTEWTGAINVAGTGASHEGAGGASWDVSGSDAVCWSFQKGTEEGFLRARLNVATVAGTDEQGFAETTASYGVVSGCSE